MQLFFILEGGDTSATACQRPSGVRGRRFTRHREDSLFLYYFKYGMYRRAYLISHLWRGCIFLTCEGLMFDMFLYNFPYKYRNVSRFLGFEKEYAPVDYLSKCIESPFSGCGRIWRLGRASSFFSKNNMRRNILFCSPSMSSARFFVHFFSSAGTCVFRQPNTGTKRLCPLSLFLLCFVYLLFCAPFICVPFILRTFYFVYLLFYVPFILCTFYFVYLFRVRLSWLGMLLPLFVSCFQRALCEKVQTDCVGCMFGLEPTHFPTLK